MGMYGYNLTRKHTHAPPLRTANPPVGRSQSCTFCVILEYKLVSFIVSLYPGVHGNYQTIASGVH